MKISLCLLASLLLALSTNAKGKETAPAAKCFKADTIKIWEEKYCLFKSGAGDAESEAFKECYRAFKKDKSVPKKKCARIVWLKDKACQDDPGVGRTRTECLADKNYLKNIKDDPYVGP